MEEPDLEAVGGYLFVLISVRCLLGCFQLDLLNVDYAPTLSFPFFGWMDGGFK